MMQLMPRDVNAIARTLTAFTRRSAPHPSRFIQVAQQCRRTPYRDVVFNTSASATRANGPFVT